MEILIKTGHLVNCSRIHRVFFRLIRKFNSTVYHSSTWDEGLVRRIFAKSLIILLLLGLSPYSSQADNDEDSHRVMTRMFKAYAKFKMADYTGARDIWESIGQGARGEALFNLAILYEDGLGVEVDLGRSLDLYRRAAALGSRSAQYRLGRLLSLGKRNKVLARKKPARPVVAKLLKAEAPNCRIPSMNITICPFHRLPADLNGNFQQESGKEPVHQPILA